jgi:hypothetical protein
MHSWMFRNGRARCGVGEVARAYKAESSVARRSRELNNTARAANGSVRTQIGGLAV